MLASRRSATNSNSETIKLLIDSNANVNLQEKDEWTSENVSTHFLGALQKNMI